VGATPTATIERLPVGRPRPEWRPYQPYGAARELMRCRAREVVLEGPADTGKSRACLEKMFLAAINHPGMRGGVFRKTRASLTQTAMATFERAVLPAGAAAFHHADQEYRFPNGSKIIVAGLDDPEKIKSLELDIVYVQEISELDEEDYEILTTRVTGRSAVMPYTQILADMNPTHPEFWLYKREAAGAVLFLHATHADNPTITEERLAPLKALTGYRRQRLYLGLRVAAEGAYFEEWDPNVHACASFTIPPDWTRWLAVDYGFADPFCALWLARAPDANRSVYAYRELYAPGLRDAQQAELIVKACKDERLALAVLDPSMFNERREQEKPSIASVYAGVLRAGGVFDVRDGESLPLYPASNARIPGWNAVRALLAHDPAAMTKPRLRVMRERCPNLIRTLPAMVRDPLDPEDLADKVKGVKTEDHVADCLRYACMVEATAPRKQPQSLRFGG
jgi:hypothetical protein